MVNIRPAEWTDRTLFKNLFNMYQHELSPYTDQFSSVDANGYFDERTVDEIFPPDNNIFPYVIEVDGRNAGLLLITRPPYIPVASDWCVQELFLLHPFRHNGTAESAVLQAMQGRSGRWSLQIYAQNAPAIRFWTRFIAQHGTQLRQYDADSGLITWVFNDV